jgi:hypothetical protein
MIVFTFSPSSTLAVALAVNTELRLDLQGLKVKTCCLLMVPHLRPGGRMKLRIFQPKDLTPSGVDEASRL